MEWIRLALRLSILIFVFPAFYLALLLGLFLFSFKKKLKISWRNFIVQWWCRALVLILGIRVTVKGKPPETPFFLVSNHLGYIDIITYFTVLHCVFVSRHDLAQWPLFGLIARSINTLFIDRTRKMDIPRINNQIDLAMQENKGLIIFPEGTSTGGKDVLRFKPSLLEYAAKNRFPISYSSLHYETGVGDPPAHRSVCYWGDMHFVSHLFNLLKLSRVQATIRFGPETIQSNDRKAIAQSAWEKIYDQFQPVYVDEK
ncbi:MAG: 1-acyl-sn-glycerol-3-phosphate acyltransferase [Calditrichaeota bacterium]|nr:MAG: 1-acyl-sn-glycerol-3-phosphate acyltransferase [Calditrichota bacterium]